MFLIWPLLNHLSVAWVLVWILFVFLCVSLIWLSSYHKRFSFDTGCLYSLYSSHVIKRCFLRRSFVGHSKTYEIVFDDTIHQFFAEQICGIHVRDRNRDLRRKKREGRKKEKKGELMPGDQRERIRKYHTAQAWPLVKWLKHQWLFVLL